MRKIKTLAVAFACALTAFAQNDYQALGEKFVKSEMTRFPVAWMIDASVSKNQPKWNYTQGLEIMSMQPWLTEYQWVTYAKGYTDSLINESGKIKGFKMKDYKLDAVNSGKILFMMYEQTKDERYKIAMDTLFLQMQQQP